METNGNHWKVLMPNKEVLDPAVDALICLMRELLLEHYTYWQDRLAAQKMRRHHLDVWLDHFQENDVDIHFFGRIGDMRLRGRTTQRIIKPEVMIPSEVIIRAIQDLQDKHCEAIADSLLFGYIATEERLKVAADPLAEDDTSEEVETLMKNARELHEKLRTKQIVLH